MVSQLKTTDLLHRPPVRDHDAVFHCGLKYTRSNYGLYTVTLQTKTVLQGAFGFCIKKKLNNLKEKKKQITDRKHLSDGIFKRDLVSTNIVLLGHIIEGL